MLIQVDLTNGLTKKDAVFKSTTFKALDLKESALEEFIRNNIQVLFTSENAQGAANESLLVIGQQVVSTQGGRTDLIGVDGNGSLTLVEIKRDVADIKQRKEPFEFQAIRYAASLATLKTPEQLVELVYAPYIEKHRQEPEFAKYIDLTASEIAIRKLNEFLSENSALATFNQKQRIVLVASEFDPQTLSAVAWLIANRVDITCFTLTPGKLLEDDFINVEKILPPPLLEDNYVDFRAAAIPGQSQPTGTAGSRQNLPKIPALIKEGLLETGEVLSIKGKDNSEATVSSASQVDFQGELVSFNEWGQRVMSWSAINIYDWAVNEQGKTLGQLRLQLSEKREKESQVESAEGIGLTGDDTATPEVSSEEGATEQSS